MTQERRPRGWADYDTGHLQVAPAAKGETVNEQELRTHAEFSEVLGAARAYTGNSDGPVEPWAARRALAEQLRINMGADTPPLRASAKAFSSQVLRALDKLAREGFLIKAPKRKPGPDGRRDMNVARFYRPAVWERAKAQGARQQAAQQQELARWKAVLAALEERGFTPRSEGFRPVMGLPDWERLTGMLGYTRDQVSAAVSAAADETYGGDRANLFVNLAMGWLDNPGATADEVIEEAYSENPAIVRGWSAL